MGFLKERRNLLVGKACDTTTYASYEESQFWVLSSKLNKLIHVGFDGLYSTLHCRNAVALTLQSNALTPDGTKLLVSDISRSATMCPSQITAKHKNLILLQMRYPLRCHSLLFHI